MPIPGHTSSEETVELEIDAVGEIPGCTAHGRTVEEPEMLATLAKGGDPDCLPDLH